VRNINTNIRRETTAVLTPATAGQAMAGLIDLAESQGWQVHITMVYGPVNEQAHLELTGKLHRTASSNQWLVKYAGGQMVLLLSGVVGVTLAQDDSMAGPAQQAAQPVLRVCGMF